MKEKFSINVLGEFITQEIKSKKVNITLEFPTFSKLYVRNIDNILFVVIENTFLHIYVLANNLEEAKYKYDNQFIHMLKKIKGIKNKKCVGSKKLYLEMMVIKNYFNRVIPKQLKNL